MVNNWLTCGLLFLSLAATGCGQSFVTDAQNAADNAQSEPPYFGLSPVAIVASEGFTPLTVTATARFERFNLTNNIYLGSQTNIGYREDQKTSYPIPVAEFQVFDSSGVRIQSGETLANGNISFQILNRPGTYTLKIYSRSLNSSLKLSVLNNLSSRTPYSVSQNFTVSNQVGTLALGSVTASATRTDQLAGAFNIHYAIYRTVQYLKAETLEFASESPAKVSAFWQVGFNPYSYFVANAQTGASFYTPDTNELFILGGMNGYFIDEDFDHFDDSVIIHEYGHFLEDEYSFSASPGGFHDADSIIDARLAWSEGWANFLQGAVRTNQINSGDLASTNSRYVDVFGLETRTSGTLLSTSESFLAFSLNESASSASTDRPIASNEGSHREFSIARTLFKGLSATDFTNYWDAFRLVRDRSVLSNTYRYFTSFQTFYTELTSGTKAQIASIVGDADEKQDLSLLHYNTPTTSNRTITGPNVTACLRTLSPVRDSSYTGKSNQFSSNDFLRYTHQAGNTSIELQAADSSTDLDLLLYNEDYSYVEDSFTGNGASIVRRKTASFGSSVVRASRSDENTESISVNGLTVGKTYLLNIKAFTAGSAAASPVPSSFSPVNYYISINSSRILCPE